MGSENKHCSQGTAGELVCRAQRTGHHTHIWVRLCQELRPFFRMLPKNQSLPSPMILWHREKCVKDPPVFHPDSQVGSFPPPPLPQG